MNIAHWEILKHNQVAYPRESEPRSSERTERADFIEAEQTLAMQSVLSQKWVILRSCSES